MPNILTKERAKQLWIHAQRLDSLEPFGHGPSAVKSAIEHLGYVQIDTINVIERCHHHILFNRIPQYRRQDLQDCQSRSKSVFEYWTHALSYVPTRDYKFHLPAMQKMRTHPGPWLKDVSKADLQKVMQRIRKEGPLSIRDIEDDVLVEKNHAWASRKPSKKALQLGFFTGRLVISERIGMLKKYELADRHFNWREKPAPASENQILDYYLNRALKSQALVSLDSICHLRPSLKPSIQKKIEQRCHKGTLLPVQVKGLEKLQFWVQPSALELKFDASLAPVHLLSPFDPLIIQRKRVFAFFDYGHLFEAYLPAQKRKFGYFGLPVLVDGQITAVLDLKTDRAQKKLLLQAWSWVGKSKKATVKKRIEEELHRFEKFQLE